MRINTNLVCHSMRGIAYTCRHTKAIISIILSHAANFTSVIGQVPLQIFANRPQLITQSKKKSTTIHLTEGGRSISNYVRIVNILIIRHKFLQISRG